MIKRDTHRDFGNSQALIDPYSKRRLHRSSKMPRKWEFSQLNREKRSRLSAAK